MIDQDQKDALFRQWARIAAALASPARLQLLSRLSHGTKSVEELARLTNQSMGATSAHLKVLRTCGLVSSKKRGKHVDYWLATPGVTAFWLSLRELSAELLPEVRELQAAFRVDEALSALDPQGLARECESGQVVLLDLRPASEFAQGHLPGARNVPFESLEAMRAALKKLSKGRRIYAYCHGPYCLIAVEGVRKLRAAGIAAQRLAFSVPEWQVAQRAGALDLFGPGKRPGTCLFTSQAAAQRTIFYKRRSDPFHAWL
jgi:rhodanese-related sulfurtransferase/DNA-binding transcriptional ArsR family regulator